MSQNSRAELIDKITSFIVVNLLWVVFAALVVTLPAATAGLFATLSPWVQGKTSEPFRDFFGGMRQHWRKSTAAVLLDVAVIGMVALNLNILNKMGIDTLPAFFARSVAFFVAAVTLLTNLYLWPLLVSVDLPLRQLIRVAVKLVFLHPAWSLVATLLALAPLLSVLLLPRFIAVLIAFSGCALLASWGAWRVLDQHKRELFDHSSTF